MDETFEHFWSLALRLNNEHPNCLKTIHSDNGTEFRNTSFDQFYHEHDIDQQFSAPRVPQQNGVVEQKNRTPRYFWVDAISTVCYISNQIFLRSILHLTPFELRFGCKFSVSHLRPFSCKCFVLKHGNLDKFESRSSDGILHEYTPHDRSYRVFNLKTNNIVESCDVTFDETAPCPHDVFKCAGDKKMEENIFVDEELQSFNRNEDKLEVEASQATTFSTAAVEASRVEGEIIS
jgi:hypothetical protein